MRALAVACLLIVAGCGGSGDAARSTGPLTVQEALESDIDGQVEVRGFVHEESGVVRLCSAILESFPPQCGQPSLRVEGYDLDGADDVQSARGVRWIEQASLVGDIEDGVLTVS